MEKHRKLSNFKLCIQPESINICQSIILSNGRVEDRGADGAKKRGGERAKRPKSGDRRPITIN